MQFHRGETKRLAREHASLRRERRVGESLRTAVLWTLAALALFLAFDGLLFHSGFYNRYVEPDSSAGEIEYRSHSLRESKQEEIVVVGDSRVAEGFSASLADKIAGHGRHFFNFGIGGTSPRIWYYMLRDQDPRRNRFPAVVIAMGAYTDEDRIVPEDDNVNHLNYLAGRLRYTDCPEFAMSFPAARRAQMFGGCVFRGLAFRSDVKDFLHAPELRLTRSKLSYEHIREFLDAYGGGPEQVTGISADFKARTLVFPPGLKQQQIASINGMVMPVIVPQTGRLTSYRERWLGAIVNLYKGTRTRVIFVELPRAPLPIPEPPTPPRFIARAATLPNVKVLPSATFRDLERPDYFGDGLHLNKYGRVPFTERLAQHVAALLDTAQ